MTHLRSIAVVVFLVMGGCQGISGSAHTATDATNGNAGNANTWDLEVSCLDYKKEAGETIHCYIAVEGVFEGELEGVSVQFLNEDKEVVKEVPVGDISDWDKHWANTTLPTQPVYFTATLESWDTPGLHPGGVNGQKIMDDGENHLYQETLPKNTTTNESVS